MDRKDELIVNLVGDLIEACGDNEQDIFLALKEKGFTLEEMREYWECCPIKEFPYEVWAIYYDENGMIVDGDTFLGAYKSEETASQVACNALKYLDGGDERAAYMVVQVELVATDDEGNSSAIDICYEADPIYKA